MNDIEEMKKAGKRAAIKEDILVLINLDPSVISILPDADLDELVKICDERIEEYDREIGELDRKIRALEDRLDEIHKGELRKNEIDDLARPMTASEVKCANELKSLEAELKSKVRESLASKASEKVKEVNEKAAECAQKERLYDLLFARVQTMDKSKSFDKC